MKQITLLLTMLFLTALGYGQTVIFEENFNGDTIPDDWVTWTSGDGDQSWTFGSGVMPGTTGVGSADFTTNAAIFDDDASGGDGNHDKSSLLFPNTFGAVNLTDYLDFQITLEYEYALNTLSTPDDTLELFISDGEGGYILVKSYGVDTDITLDTVDVTQLLADNPGMDVTNFFFKFVYDDIDSDWSYGAGIDNVRLIATPVNDNICDAIPLSVGSISEGDAYTTTGATAEENEPIGECTNDVVDGSVWFTFVANYPTITVSTDIAGGEMTDTELTVFEAPTDCADASTLGAIVGCDQDSGVIVNWNSIVELSDLTVGDTYYIQVDKWFDPFGTFGISVVIPPPANDECVNAIPLDTQYGVADFDSALKIAGTIAGATDSGLPAEVCDGYTGTANDDVWYSFVPNSDSVHITFDEDFDGVINLLEGSCGDFTLIGCNDEIGAGIEQIDATGLTVGEEYFLRIFSWTGGTPSTFDFEVAVWSDGPGVGIAEAVIDGFSMYPNPVEDILTINADSSIDAINVFNLVGQEVLKASPNATETQLDMSSLPAGAYIVKVQAGTQLGSYNLIKE